MKRVLLLAMAALLAIQAAAQENEREQLSGQRNLKLMVRDKKGRTIPDMELTAGLKGSDQMLYLDRFGNRFFKVTDDDVIMLVTDRNIYEFPVEGLDSLYVVFGNRNRIAGYIPRGGNEMINIGYGTVSRRSNTAAVSTLDMKNAGNYSDLRSYMRGRVAGVTFTPGGVPIIRGVSSINSGIEALIVVDGMAMPNFASVNSSIRPADVASISVLKDAASTAIYGVRGANGVILIKTKSGGDSK